MTNKELENKANELEKELKEIKKQLQKNKKITLKEFCESKQELAIHCDTEEKAKTLLSAFDKMGKKWKLGGRYTEFNHWSDCGQKTIYYNDGTYGSSNAFDMIYEFENVDLTLPKECQFSEDEKTILRNLDKKWKWLVRDKNGSLYIYTHKPQKFITETYSCYSCIEGSGLPFNTFEHLFQSIQWTDDEPVEIAKVIGE